MDEKVDIKEEVNSEKKAEDKKTEAKKAGKDKVIKIKESELNQLKEEAAESKDKYLRLYAEFDNFRKRTEREKAEFVKYANEGIITEFLGVLDNLELSFKSAKEKHQDYEAFVKGIEMVMANTYEVLKKNGVEPIKALGQKFDPHAHEILLQEESDEVEEGVVMEEFQKGYMLENKVIRTVKVKVAKKKE